MYCPMTSQQYRDHDTGVCTFEVSKWVGIETVIYAALKALDAHASKLRDDLRSVLRPAVKCPRPVTVVRLV